MLTIANSLIINVEAFISYALTTAQVFIEKYIYNRKDITFIGKLNEEAQEARNKKFKR